MSLSSDVMNGFYKSKDGRVSQPTKEEDTSQLVLKCQRHQQGFHMPTANIWTFAQDTEIKQHVKS